MGQKSLPVISKTRHLSRASRRPISRATSSKLGWESVANLNHFDLVKEIFTNEFYITRDEMRVLFRPEMLSAMQDTANREFSRLFSRERMMMINECLTYRYKTIWEIVK